MKGCGPCITVNMLIAHERGLQSVYDVADRDQRQLQLSVWVTHQTLLTWCGNWELGGNTANSDHKLRANTLAAFIDVQYCLTPIVSPVIIPLPMFAQGLQGGADWSNLSAMLDGLLDGAIGKAREGARMRPSSARIHFHDMTSQEKIEWVVFTVLHIYFSRELADMMHAYPAYMMFT